MKEQSFLAVLGFAAFTASSALAQQGDGTDVAISTHVTKPLLVPTTTASLAAIKAPNGFAVNVFAKDLKNVRVIAVSENGNVYVSRRDQGDVVLLKDANRDGKADGAPVVVANRAGAHGLAVHDGKLYLLTVKELFVATIMPDGKLGPLEMILGDLPDSGQHPNRTLAFGPDDMIYLSVGSTCNACNESNPENATLLRISPDGKSRTIFATGLRNMIGFDWHPSTGELWGMDNGIDFLADDQQPEELNRIELGKQYGWPHIWGAGGVNPQSTPPGGITKAQWKAMSVPQALGYTAHAAPMQMLFYKGSGFPAEFAGDAFVAMRGSWNRKIPSGYEIVRIRYSAGQPRSVETFVTGFLSADGKTHTARPMGLAMAQDGSILMTDDANGYIYRVAYTGTAARATAAKAPDRAMKEQTSRGVGVPLALARPQTQPKSAARIELRSPAFGSNASIPLKFSEYADGVAPELNWPAVSGAKSYAIVMEDPDAKPITPFVHWVAWNIPGELTRLPEGLQEQMRLTEPEALLQGRTSRGTIGYLGPRPPVGDPPHHYHLQIFAVDALLDIPPGSDREVLLTALQGHVLAKGELVGLYQQTQEPLK